jgi:hypothetical protein
MKKVAEKKAKIDKTSNPRPPNLEGMHLIKPKKVRKNHSGMILSGVLTTFVTSKLSS